MLHQICQTLPDYVSGHLKIFIARSSKRVTWNEMISHGHFECKLPNDCVKRVKLCTSVAQWLSFRYVWTFPFQRRLYSAPTITRNKTAFMLWCISVHFILLGLNETFSVLPRLRMPVASRLPLLRLPEVPPRPEDCHCPHPRPPTIPVTQHSG